MDENNDLSFIYENLSDRLINIIISKSLESMSKIVEVKEPITDSSIIDNLYHIQKLVKYMINLTEFIEESNKTDMDYINIILDKTKVNLQKIYSILKLT